MGFGNLGVPGAVKMSSGTPSVGSQVGSMLGTFAPFAGPQSSSGGGFSGGFSKNFGKNFLDIWKSGGMGGGSSSGDGDTTFGPTTMGGGSISPIGNSKHFLYQYTHPQATIMPPGQSEPGLGEKIFDTALNAGVSAGVGALFCDERLKVDMAPLESTEVNDSLAEIAFFVKGLRECA